MLYLLDPGPYCTLGSRNRFAFAVTPAMTLDRHDVEGAVRMESESEPQIIDGGE